MALREIRTFDDSILRKKSKPVEQVNDRIRLILDDMVETLHNTPNGGALAANQIGILRRLVVIDIGDGVRKLINPVVVSSQGEQFETEACLSFPGLWGKVRRPQSVVVKALDENGCEVEIQASGFMSKCLCHEIDHLDGIVFTDKAEEVNGE